MVIVACVIISIYNLIKEVTFYKTNVNNTKYILND